MEMSNYKKVLDELYSTVEEKNHDYGDSFEKTLDEFGITAVAIRLNDKVERLKTLTKGIYAKVDESIEDTLRDVAGYSTLALAYLDDHKVAKNDLVKCPNDLLPGIIKGYYNAMLAYLPTSMAHVLDDIVKKEVEAGAAMTKVTIDRCTAFDENDKDIYICFATDNDLPELTFSIVANYRWNQQSGEWWYRIKRVTKNSEIILANGGSDKC